MIEGKIPEGTVLYIPVKRVWTRVVTTSPTDATDEMITVKLDGYPSLALRSRVRTEDQHAAILLTQ